MKRQRNRSKEVRRQAGDPAIPPAALPHEVIACRAHERFVQRGGSHGQDLEDWLAAERELRDESTRRTHT